MVRTASDVLTLANNRELCPSIAVLRRDYGSEAIADIIMLYLADLRDNVNLKRPLTDNQISNIAYEVVTEYYSLTIADVHVIMKKAKRGEYGELFESLDMPKVMTWFREYFADRCTLAAQESENNRIYDKNGNMTPERITKHFEKLEKQFNKGNK
jgi:hypothetical protein